MQIIREMKEANPLTETCITRTNLDAQTLSWTQRWIYRTTGLDAAEHIACEEQHRIDRLLHYPVPTTVLVNVVWRGIVGDNPAAAFTQFIGAQSYIIQVTLIIVPAILGVIAFYIFWKHFPAWFSAQMVSPEGEKKEKLKMIQVQLRKKEKPATTKKKKKSMIQAYTRPKFRMKFTEIDKYLPKAEP